MIDQAGFFDACPGRLLFGLATARNKKTQLGLKIHNSF
jgi:hypothetical protein